MSDHDHSTGFGQMVLGTAQLGLPQYGIANAGVRLNEAQCAEILRVAVELGVGAIDTARAYGEAEVRIGRALGSRAAEVSIVTKLASDDVSGWSSAEAEKLVEQSVAASLEALGVPRLSTLLLHRWDQRCACGGAVWERLKRLQTQGLIGRLGVSAHAPVEARQALADPEVQHLEMPFNLFDWRWKKAGVIEHLQTRPDITVHTRSTFLQGLMFLPPERWPLGSPELARGAVEILNTSVAEFSRVSVADLALAAVRAMPWSDGVIVGLETLEQLHMNAELFRRPPLAWSEAVALAARFGHLPKEVLDPDRWPARS